MRTIRKRVFETNSSTTHCISFSKDYKKITDIPLRDKSEFPALDANGNLEIELNIYWDNDVVQTDMDFSSAEVFIKYLAAQAVFSSLECLYGGRKNTEYKNHYDKNHVDFLKDLQNAYLKIGLTPPNDVRPYFLDINDNKIYFNKDNVYNWFDTYDNSWYDSKKDYDRNIAKRIKKNPDAANWPYAKNKMGVCGNDLSHNSYEDATHYFESNFSYWNDDENEESNNDFDFTTVDVLTRKVTLGFYHS